MCPCIEKSDTRCANHLTLRNLSHAFVHCADHYESCPVYRKLIAEKTHARYEEAQLLAAC